MNIFKEINISKIYKDKNKDKFPRFNSWEHCYKAFGEKHDNDYLALHLSFYLASWGMYRGSSKLLQKDYKIHVEAVGIINNYKDLRNVIISTNLDNIIQLKDELVGYYANNRVSATDTLISKILMGTLGCLPAFDRFFKDGVVANNLKFKSLKKSSLEYLFSFIEDNINQLESLQKQVNKQQKIDYPIMKIVDMLFWNKGFELDKNKRKSKS